MEKESGVVAVFDILGYQNIIDNNEIESSAEIICEIIEKLPGLTGQTLLSFIDEDKKENYTKKLERINYRLISDTILFSMNSDLNLYDLFIFLSAVSMFQKLSFDNGLPLRSAIDFGDYFISGNCFAGKPIIDAFRLSQQLDFSGCVCTNKLYVKIKDDLKLKKDVFLIPYLAPLKENKYLRTFIINWLSPYDKWGLQVNDTKQYIVNQFHKHNKDITKEVITKLENTEIILRYTQTKEWLK